MSIKQLAMAALIYFAIAFGIGFLLGTLRVLWLAPQLGVRDAELAEIPIMLLAVFFVARWVTQYCAIPPIATARLVVGISAPICLLLGGVHSSAMATGHQHCGILRQSRFHLRRSLPSQSNLVCVNALLVNRFP